jgi:hypothetical protein
LLLLEREEDEDTRATNVIRFIRLRRPLAQFIPDPSSAERRGRIEELLEIMLAAPATEDDPRWQVNVVAQGEDGGLEIDAGNDDQGLLEEEEE